MDRKRLPKFLQSKMRRQVSMIIVFTVSISSSNPDHTIAMASSSKPVARSILQSTSLLFRSSQKAQIHTSRIFIAKAISSRTIQRHSQPLSSQCLRLRRQFSLSAARRSPSEGDGRTQHRTGVRIALRGTSITSTYTLTAILTAVSGAFRRNRSRARCVLPIREGATWEEARCGDE